MKKLGYLGFCLVLLAGFGCAITDYEIITDNNQVSGGKAAKQLGGEPINTSGKAHVNETSQLVTIWPDGTDNLINFVDQKTDGTATLYTYNNHSTGLEPIFHDDLYCNTDRQGCSIFTAPDDNDDNLFDGRFDEHCYGARSLMLLVAARRTYYYGECGKTLARGRKTSIEDKIRLLNAGALANRFGREGLLYNMNASNLSVVLTNENGQTFALPLRGSLGLWISGNDNWGTLDVRNSLISSSLTWYAEFLENDATEVTTATVTYNGISIPFTISGRHPVIGRDAVLGIRNRAF